MSASLDQHPHRMFIIAGEASGDHLGSDFVSSLKDITARTGDNIIFHGVGGPHLELQGVESLFPFEELSVMGIAEVLPQLINIIKRINQTADYIVKNNIDTVVTIDSPDFCFRVAKKVQKRSNRKIKFYHYVAPTVWAWRPKRAKKVAALYDGLMCLFPFEPDYFIKEGMSATCVGHSAITRAQEQKDRVDVRQYYNIPEQRKILGVLFGSRKGEIARMGPLFVTALQAMLEEQPDENYHLICPTLPHLAAEVERLTEPFGDRCTVITDKAHKWPAFYAMDRAIATSGTVGLELAIADVPHLIAYKINVLTWAFVKWRIKTSFAHLGNILLDRALVPEFLQWDATTDNIKDGLAQLHVSQTVQAQRDGFRDIRLLLCGEDKEKPPAEQAASYILSQIKA